MVNIELVDDKLSLSKDQLERMSSFLNYTFTKVLRLHKYFMTFDPMNALSSYLIVPTITGAYISIDTGTSSSSVLTSHNFSEFFVDPNGDIKVDWDFVNQIYERKNEELKVILDRDRINFTFQKHLYNDAVVMPWYRNQDFPQVWKTI